MVPSSFTLQGFQIEISAFILYVAVIGYVPSKGIEDMGDEAQSKRGGGLFAVNPPVWIVGGVCVQGHLVGTGLVCRCGGVSRMAAAEEGEHDQATPRIGPE